MISQVTGNRRPWRLINTLIPGLLQEAGVKPLTKKDVLATTETKVSYTEAVEALMWAQTRTKPCLSFAVQTAAKLRDNPLLVHSRAEMKTLPYICRPKVVDITYGGVVQSDMTMSVQVDSGHATYPDS